MPRYFTLAQAQALLPEVERLLKLAVKARAALAEAEREIGSVQRKATLMGGMNIDRPRMILLRQQRETNAEDLKNSVETITEFGVQVKDLDIGLIDFPTLYNDEEVLLCWRLGESGIEYWHGLEDGFRGRRRIDRDFVDRHRGDEAQ